MKDESDRRGCYSLGTNVPHTRLALEACQVDPCHSPSPVFAPSLARVYERRSLLLAVAACQNPTLAKIVALWQGWVGRPLPVAQRQRHRELGRVSVVLPKQHDWQKQWVRSLPAEVIVTAVE